MVGLISHPNSPVQICLGGQDEPNLSVFFLNGSYKIRLLFWIMKVTKFLSVVSVCNLNGTLGSEKPIILYTDNAQFIYSKYTSILPFQKIYLLLATLYSSVSGDRTCYLL